MNEQSVNMFMKAGTAGGTLTVFFITIATEDIIKTLILSAIGTVVSFAVTLLLKLVIRRLKK